MSAVSRLWVFRVALLMPAIVLAVLAIPRLATGLLLQRSFPATAYIETNTPLPASSYGEVADILSHASRRDAATALFQAEAAINAGASSSLVIPTVRRAVTHSPLSARGWIILASLLTQQNPKQAAADLTLAFDLAPRDYYLILPRTLVGASLWNELPSRVRAVLLKDTGAMANDPDARGQLRLLLSKPGGSNLVSMAFAGKPEALRELNRSLALETLHLP
jgi:hypothetical protein